MNSGARWLLFVAALGLMACLAGPLAVSPTATPAPTATVPPTVVAAVASPTPLIAPPATAAPTVAQPTAGCAAWFFSARQGLDPVGCAEPVVQVSAVGEDFVGGRVYRYDPTPDFPDKRGIIFVIYNDRTWDTYVDQFTTGDPDTDPSINPPSGRFQPAGPIGKLWRDTPAVRSALGWAYGPAAPFNGRYQIPQGGDQTIYVDHGKGLVLRLTSTNQSKTWVVVGDY